MVLTCVFFLSTRSGYVTSAPTATASSRWTITSEYLKIKKKALLKESYKQQYKNITKVMENQS